MHSPAVRAQAMKLADAGFNDCDIARRTGIARTTIRDWRRPRYTRREPPTPGTLCPRCWRSSTPMSFSTSDYAELLGLYLGDGYIVRMPRTFRLRIYLDSRYRCVVEGSKALLRRCFPSNMVGSVLAHDGRMTILNVYSSHLPCLFPQHGPGKKHERAIVLEPWQQQTVDEAPWRFLRGCIWSDGCSYINRTGPYEYLSYEFSNRSSQILDLFERACDNVGI
jgi:hypothetical protein